MKHIHAVSKTPSVAAADPNFLLIISFVTFGFEIATVLFSAFGSIFEGLVSAITTFASSKNMEMQ